MTKQQILQKIASKAYDGLYKEAGFGSWLMDNPWGRVTGETQAREAQERAEKFRKDSITKREQERGAAALNLHNQVMDRSKRGKPMTEQEYRDAASNIPRTMEHSSANGNMGAAKDQYEKQLKQEYGWKEPNNPLIAQQPQQTQTQSGYNPYNPGYNPYNPGYQPPHPQQTQTPSGYSPYDPGYQPPHPQQPHNVDYGYPSQIPGLPGRLQPMPLPHPQQPPTQSGYNPYDPGYQPPHPQQTQPQYGYNPYNPGYQPQQPQGPSMDDVNDMRDQGQQGFAGSPQHSNTSQQRARFQLSGRASGIPGVPSGKRLNRRQWSRRSVPVYAQGYNY